MFAFSIKHSEVFSCQFTTNLAQIPVENIIIIWSGALSDFQHDYSARGPRALFVRAEPNDFARSIMCPCYAVMGLTESIHAAMLMNKKC